MRINYPTFGDILTEIVLQQVVIPIQTCTNHIPISNYQESFAFLSFHFLSSHGHGINSGK